MKPKDATDRSEIELVGFRAELAPAFEALNRRWIEEYFVVEAADLEVFSDPYSAIVEPGGQIFFVLEDGEPRGTCAVIRHDPQLFELAKMAVEPLSQGRGYGNLLIERAIRFARESGGERLMLVTNSRLDAAIHLYEKHGFKSVPISHAEHYSRVDVEMELRVR
jgi:GNAT superfamily N-acetyltransferase